MKCPICDRDVAARETNKAWPFCSERCRLADLGKWLGEEYRIPEEDKPTATATATASAEPPEKS